MLKICTLKMLLNFIVIVQEPWKASVSEVNQITPRDGTEPRALDVNSDACVRARAGAAPFREVETRHEKSIQA